MDNFREWLSDNLRYILLGLAIILILTIAILAVRFIGAGIGGDTNGGNSGSGTGTEAVTPAGTEGQSETAGSGLPDQESLAHEFADPSFLILYRNSLSGFY